MVGSLLISMTLLHRYHTLQQYQDSGNDLTNISQKVHKRGQVTDDAIVIDCTQDKEKPSVYNIVYATTT